MKLAALILFIGLVGCSAQEPIALEQDTTPVAHKPPADEILRGLAFEAKKHGLRFVVFCVPRWRGQQSYYQASAENKKAPDMNSLLYIEDGGVDWWAYDGPTAEDAAYRLYLALATGRKPTHIAKHRPAKEPSSPDPSCNYNTVYDSNHTHKIPCKDAK